MPDFHSIQARKLMDDSLPMNLLAWYTYFKYPLFDSIRHAATNGNNSITVKVEEWGKSKYKKKYLLDQLNELGYKVEFRNNESEMLIIW